MPELREGYVWTSDMDKGTELTSSLRQMYGLLGKIRSVDAGFTVKLSLWEYTVDKE